MEDIHTLREDLTCTFNLYCVCFVDVSSSTVSLIILRRSGNLVADDGAQRLRGGAFLGQIRPVP